MKTFLTIGLSVGAVGSVVAGGLAVNSFLAGGGTQPEDVLPASTIAFAKVDLNPSAGQKLNALRLMRKFPDIKDEGEDLKATLVEALLDESDLKLKYEADIEPWLGDRAAIAVVPSSNNDDGVAPLVALEFTDEAAMVAALEKAEKEMLAQNMDGHLAVLEPSDAASFESEQGTATGDSPDAQLGTASDGSSAPEPGTLPDDFTAPEPSAEPGTVPDSFTAVEPGTTEGSGSAVKPSEVPESFVVEEQGGESSGDTPDPTAEDIAGVSPTTKGRVMTPPTKEELDPFDYAIRDGYVILSEHQSDVDDAVAAAQVLSGHASFSADKAAIDGTDQIVLGWLNVGAVYDVVPDDEKADFAEQFGSARPGGRVVVGVHVEPDAVEAVGRTIDLEAAGAEALAAGGPGTGIVNDLPPHTSVAFSATGLGDLAADLWDEHGESLLGDAEEIEELGLRLPDDLYAVLGDEAAVGVTLDEVGDGEVGATARVRSAEAERALKIIGDWEEMAEDRLHSAPVEDGYVISSDADDLADASDGDLSLAENPVFANAVPEADDASVLLFVNIPDVVDAIEAAFGSSDEPEEPMPLQAFGATATGEAGNGTFKLRLTFR